MEKKKVITRENKWERSHFDVLGLCCSSEIPLIENILKPLQGIKEISVIIPTRTLIVVHDSLLISQIQIVKALNEARLEANVRVNGKGIKKKKWPNAWTIGSGILLTASFLKYLYHPLRWLAVGAVAVAVTPILLKAFSSIRHLRIDVNILAIISVVGTIAMNDYTEAGSIVFLFSIAEWLESRASHKANVAMSTLMSLAPQKAVIEETGEMVGVNQVKLKTLLAVKAGEVIPIDGIVVEGKCEVDEKTLTGETFPVAKQKDSLVWAGTINLNGYISVQTSVVAEDCVVAKMAKLVEDAQNNKSKTQRFIDRCAKYYTPAVLVISACFAAIPAALRVENLKHWFHLALVVLVSACPCALILSTPVATFCALTKAAMSGLLIKGGDHLEVLAKIKVMAFDKTGTITSGEFVVTDFRALQDDISLDTLLTWVSSIESKSSHPMAAALVSHGKLHSIDIKPENVEEFENFPGEGIHGKIDGNHIYIGSRKISARAGCLTAPSIDNETKLGWTVSYVFCGATLVGTFSLSDTCRSGVKEAINEVKKFGIKTAMLTGDCRAAAMYAQQQLGNALDIVHSELLPEEKANLIKGFKKDGPTAMVGDGINDTPALATADIGISMGVSGSALATETGNVILMSNDMRKIPKAIKLAKQCQMKVIQNVILSIGTKTAILGLAFAGHPLVWAAVLADVGTCLLVILNSMLLLRGTNKHRRKCRDKSSEPCQKKHGSNLGNGQLSHQHAHHDHKHCCSEEKAHKAQSMEPSNSNSEKNRCPDSKSQVQCANNGDRGDHQCRKIQSHSPSEHCHTSLCGDHDHKHCCSEEKAQQTQSMEPSNSNWYKKNRCSDSESQVQCANNGDCGDHQCRKIRCHSPSEHCHTSLCRDSERRKGNCEETNEPHEEKHELFQIEKEEINIDSSNCKINSHHIAIDIHESIDCERKEHKIGK